MGKDFGAIVTAATSAFSEAPENARMEFKCDSELVADCECTNTARQHTFTIDEPAMLGGGDKGANPVEALLGALASCRIITYQFHAGRLGIPLTSVSVSFTGDLDLRGFLAMDDSIRPGYQSISGDCTLVTDATEEQIAALEAAVEKYCPVADVVRNLTPISINTKTVGIAAAAAD